MALRILVVVSICLLGAGLCNLLDHVEPDEDYVTSPVVDADDPAEATVTNAPETTTEDVRRPVVPTNVPTNNLKNFQATTTTPTTRIPVLDDEPILGNNAQSEKPKASDWIQGRHPNSKLNLIAWLVDGIPNCFVRNGSSVNCMDDYCVSSACERILEARKEKERIPAEVQSYDGFFNNIFKTDLGAVDTPLLRRVPPVYDDGVYLPVTKNRINPFKASDLMNRSLSNCNDTLNIPCGSRTGKTAFLVFFGQQVVEEILDAQRPGCPPEYFNLEIPEGHRFRNKDGLNKQHMPLLRSRYAQSSGQSPGNPRQQLNEITPWFDGGLIYGTAKGWADVLRTMNDGELHPEGKLASEQELGMGSGLFPRNNSIRLPLANPPPPARHCEWTKKHETANVNRFFVLGNPRGNENAFLLTFGIVLFRWHNHIAEYFSRTREHWSGERVFNEARKWVIATHQQIVYYDWLTEWLGEPLGKYQGYDAAIDPQVEQFFQTAAMRFGHTLVTPGGYLRDYNCRKCLPLPFKGLQHSPDTTYSGPSTKPSDESISKGAVRTCNIFWRPQEPLIMKTNSTLRPTNDCPTETFQGQEVAGVDRMLMGLASQRAEREDNMIVEDLRGNVFGPLEFSRRDLMAVNIQRGRDHGTPDYNTARESFGLPRICSVSDYLRHSGLEADYHNEGSRLREIRAVIRAMADVHNLTDLPVGHSDASCWNNIDVWTGGILETNRHRPGPLFRAIIKDQFVRIRSADRFWFENNRIGQWNPPRFTDDQIQRIQQLKIFDLIVSVTYMKEEDIQANPFRLPDADENKIPETCRQESSFVRTTCYTPEREQQGKTTEKRHVCFQFPQMHTAGHAVEDCSPPGTYDYFSGSELSYIVTFVVLGATIIGIGTLAPSIATLKRRSKQADAGKAQQKLRQSFRSVGIKGTVFTGREWQGKVDGYRSAVFVLNDEHSFDIRSHNGEVLRHVNLEGRSEIEIILVTDGCHLVVKNPQEFDCVIQFESTFIRDSFVSAFRSKYCKGIDLSENQQTLKQTLSSAVTKTDRLKRLETFFRLVFAHAFHIDEPKGSKKSEDPKVIREVFSTELTRAEFSDALGMRGGSKFVEKMFDLVDKDRSGTINFREFLDMLIIFAKGTAEDKAKLMFDMYDIERDGKLSINEFVEMIRSLIDAANADSAIENTDELIHQMVEQAGFTRDSQVTFADFQKLLGKHQDILGSANLSFSGANIPADAKLQAKGRGARHSFVDIARATAVSIYDSEDPETAVSALDKPEDEGKNMPGDFGMPLTVIKERHHKQPASVFIERFRLEIFWVTMYTLVVLAIFAERAYYYSVEREHGGLRHIAGYGVTVTRGAASAMMFCYATLLIPMCRNILSYLRETFLHRLIPFHFVITMHKYIAILGLVFTLIHIVGHAINFYHISTQTAVDLACLFRDFFRPTHVLPKFHYWCFQTVTGITGILLVIHGTFLYTFSTNYARTHAFRMFWIVHNTYPLWYILMLIHGSGRLVQDPIFQYFLVGPLLLFILDQLIAASRKRIEIPVIKADILPSNVTKLEFARPSGFDYKSGQWVRIACTALSSNEFHPFTLSSAPHEPNLSLHIRAVGPFTTFIRQIYERTPTCPPSLFLDGPYGEGHQDWWRYKVSVLIGGGIGVTPFASILKDVANNSNPRNCKKIYFLWVTRTQKQFEWLVDIIRDVEQHNLISVHIFVTQVYNKFDMRTTLLYICERHFQKISNRSLFTGLRSVTHFGRPDFALFLRGLRTIHPNVYKFGVFSCGPLEMTRRVDEACSSANNDVEASSVTFQHHVENF
ncbi:unnamed protein product [Allacma fusca]|uniref:NAD(P)H oxidase (H(2)O(2)-forming) n=1 Tax=Allacma fusca TaxID=39272 RepID=A0A8J2K909_9HEXA|nr:unnamed protein product [Allacma fusca]